MYRVTDTPIQNKAIPTRQRVDSRITVSHKVVMVQGIARPLITEHFLPLPITFTSNISSVLSSDTDVNFEEQRNP